MANSEEALHNAIETLHDTLKIEFEEGADMLLARHEPARARVR